MFKTRVAQVASNVWLVIVVNVLSVAVMIIDLLVQQPFIPTDKLPYLVFAIGVINIIIKALSVWLV
jgi:hypothetical protein